MFIKEWNGENAFWQQISMPIFLALLNLFLSINKLLDALWIMIALRMIITMGFCKLLYQYSFLKTIWTLPCDVTSPAENTGDPWLEFSADNRPEPGSFDYLDAIWFLMVTCSTVGYGDVSPETVLGKIAVMFFLCSKFLHNIVTNIHSETIHGRLSNGGAK